MLGLLARVVIGVALGGLAGAATYGVYIRLTRDTVKKEINEKIQNSDVFKDAFKAKFKGKNENGETFTFEDMDKWDEPLGNGETFTFEVMDKWDEPLGDVDLHGDEIASDIEIGDEIILVN